MKLPNLYHAVSWGLSLSMVACVSVPRYEPVQGVMPKLEVAFADPAWTGLELPPGQQCSLQGGKGQTPSLVVGKVPPEANAIIVEFNDASYAPLSYDGGHGKIGYWVSGSDRVTLASVPGETDHLNVENAFVEAPARTTGRYLTPGYLPPCSGGLGNTYTAIVKAVLKPRAQGEVGRLLAEQSVVIGKY